MWTPAFAEAQVTLFRSSPDLLSVKEEQNKTKQTTNPCQFQHFCPYDWQLSSTALLRLLQVGIPSPELIKSVLLLPLIYCHRNQNEHWKTSIFVHFLHK